MLFYDSYYEAASKLPPRKRAPFLVGILDYYYTGQKPDLQPAQMAMFELCKPLLDKSRSGKERGAKGNLALREIKTQKEKEKETPIDMGEKKTAAPAPAPSPVAASSIPGGDVPPLGQVIAAATGVMGVPENFARWWYREMTARDWTNTDGTTIGLRNWRPVLKAWWNNRRDSEMHEINAAAAESRERERTYSPADWGLCRERCANCGKLGCTAGAKVPPQFWAPPQQPEQCPRFKKV